LVEPSMSVNKKVTVPVGGLLIRFASSFPLQEDTIAAWARPSPHSPKCLERLSENS
jgi:hypothetical protein